MLTESLTSIPAEKLSPTKLQFTKNAMCPILIKSISRAGEVTKQMAGRFKIWRKPERGLAKKPMSTAKNIISAPVGAIYPTSASHIIHLKSTGKQTEFRSNRRIITRIYK